MGRRGRGLLPRSWHGSVALIGVGLLLLIVPLRHVVLDTNGPATALTIGVDGANAAGMLYVDDTRLYPLAGESITPTEPTTGLVAHYNFNNNAQDVRLAVLKEFSKYDRVSFSNTFRHAEDPSSFEDAFGRTAGRYSFYRNSMNLQYSRDLSKQLGLLVGYDNEIYEVDRANSSDSFLNRVSVELDYFRSSATVFILAYYFSVRDLDPGANSTVHSLVTGVRHYLTKQLYVDATTGLSLVEDFSGKTSTDPRIFLTLTDDIDENTSVSVSFQKEKFPNGYTEDVFDYWQLTARVRHQLVERMGVVFSGFYGDGDFDSLNIRDKLTGVSTRLNYDLTEHVSAYVDYTYSQTQSNVDARGYERNIITVGMNCSF